MHTDVRLIQCQTGTPEWLGIRRMGLGGSDAAPALGMSKWKSPYALWSEKVGEADPVEETWPMKRGKAMEPLLRQHYSDTTGREVRVPEGVLQHPTLDFMLYTPDGFSDDGRLQEFKTSFNATGWGEIGSDLIPQEYMLQVQHGMIVTGLPVADVTVSIAGGEPRYYEVPADKELHEMIIECEHEFWKLVQSRIAPEPVTLEDLQRVHRVLNKNPIYASEEIIDAVIDLIKVKARIKTSEEDKAAIELRIKTFMAAHETLIDANNMVLATWKQAKGAVRLDGKALKEDKPLIYEEYTVTSEPTRRFLLK